MYAPPYLHDDYAAGLEDTIVHALYACVFGRARNEEVVYLDTHAAAGRYLLGHIRKSRRETVRRSCQLLYGATSVKHFAARLFQNHLKQHNRGARRLSVFPGSPELSRSLLKRRQQSILSELNPPVHARLSNLVRQHPLTSVVCADGFELAASLPRSEMASHRHLILVDPAYEVRNGEIQDYERLWSTFQIVANIPNVAVMATYPSATTADRTRGNELFQRLASQGIQFSHAEMTFNSPMHGLRGAGVLLVNGNPLFRFDSARLLAELKQVLGLHQARIRTGGTYLSGSTQTKLFA